MGYTTYFDGRIESNRPFSDELVEYLNKFAYCRHMQRDNDKIKENYPDWEDRCFFGELGNEGEFFVGAEGDFGQGNTSDIINYNNPAPGVPGLWCQWVPSADKMGIEWDEGEKFYEYVEWMEYIIEKFLAPAYVMNGSITWHGEDWTDFGVINVVNNEVEAIYGADSLIDQVTDSVLKDEYKKRFIP